MTLVAACPVVVVRLTDGGTVTLRNGETVPPEADETHATRLTEKGLLRRRRPRKGPDPQADASGSEQGHDEPDTGAAVPGATEK